MSNKLQGIEDYFLSPNLSQSFLKKFIKDQPRSLLRQKEQKLYYEEKKHFIQGSIIDFLCTLSDEDINELYCIDTQLEKPSPAIMSIIHEIKDEGLQFNEESILLIRDRRSYQPKWKEETVIKNILTEKNIEYFDYLVKCGDKQIVSQEEWDLSVKCAHSLINGEYTSKYFSDPNMQYQVAIYRRNMKGLIDMLYLNHEDKTFRVIDIKSTAEYLENFDVFRFRYDFQLHFYSDLVQMEYPDYKALNPIILAVSKKEPDYAEPFEFTDESINIGRYGNEDYVGYDEALENYMYWEQNNNFYNQKLISQGVNYV